MYFMGHAAPSEKLSDAGTDAEANVYRPVYVSAVEHPEHFWMQILNEQATQLDILMREMTSFYDTQVRLEC